MKINCEQEVEITKKTLRNILIITLAFRWIDILKYLLAPEKYCFGEMIGGICGIYLAIYGIVYAYKWSKIHEFI